MRKYGKLDEWSQNAIIDIKFMKLTNAAANLWIQYSAFSLLSKHTCNLNMR